MFSKENFSTTCSDGVVLKGLLLIPDAPKGIVQFNNGTAAKKEFYLAFLEYLASNGYICCLWDYRGSGESAPPNLAKCDYTFSDYGVKDMPTIKDYLRERFPQLPFFIFGHSAGGQMAGFMNNLADVQGLLCFAVSVGHAPFMPLYYRFLTNFFFDFFTPLSTAITGYLPAKRYGIMEDLPKKVVLEWRAWSRKPNYFFNEKFYGRSVPKGDFQNYTFPVHIFWATDDPIANEKSIPAYWDNVKSTHGIHFTKLDPKDIQEKKIDHFGFFRKRMKTKLWPLALAKLDEFLQASSVGEIL